MADQGVASAATTQPQPCLCEGALDEHNQPACDGPDVQRCLVITDIGEKFTTYYCSDCRTLAVAEHGYHVVPMGRR